MLALTISLFFFSATAETLKVGELAQGAEFTKCINVTDFNSKSLTDEVEVTEKVDGCCPEGYIPGIKHYNNYWGSMVICGFKDDGSVAMSTSTSNGVKTCTYNKCYVVKMDVTCKDSSKMTLDGCCPKEQWNDNCKKYTKSQSFFSKTVDYCLSYAKNYKLEGTSDKTDDVVDGVLSLTNLKAYTECAGAFGGGTSAEPAPAPGSAPSPAEGSAAPAEGSGKGPVVGGKELTCDDETYIKPTLDSLATTFENYKSCNEETQKYTLEVSGYETELQAGKNGNSNQYGLGMMCVGGNMYYIYTVDTEQATWDALKASPPDESGVLLKCLLKEGSGGGGGGDGASTTSNAMRTAGGAFALVGASMMA
eukprot:gnl/MRDRNA2_/MRDRNA2_86143_c0_seq2.p1 gnl/MRDRNA2_/MRDRNA2_86143_c0~~gnl/MRDRNA2_/MRDRNA2_86143_c0_seq2.p1  ORF type:complete len:364 (-),score=99.65 gnl/MRDRNA2_/MRDRNA2_86143_c0_seq2:231-1322(-)